MGSLLNRMGLPIICKTNFGSYLPNLPTQFGGYTYLLYRGTKQDYNCWHKSGPLTVWGLFTLWGYYNCDGDQGGIITIR